MGFLVLIFLAIGASQATGKAASKRRLNSRKGPDQSVPNYPYFMSEIIPMLDLAI
jgi:hypothetical protein